MSSCSFENNVTYKEVAYKSLIYTCLPIPMLGQDMTQGQFLSRV